jgi:hypothetical protein
VNPVTPSKRSHNTQPVGGNRSQSALSYMTQPVGGYRREPGRNTKSYFTTPPRDQANTPEIFGKVESPGRESDLSVVARPIKLPSRQKVDTGRGTSNSDLDNANPYRTSDESNVDEMRQNYENFTK